MKRSFHTVWRYAEGEENAMKKEIKMYEEGLEEHPKAGIILGNLTMIL